MKIIGKLYHDLTVEYLEFYLLSDEFDLSVVNQMIPIIYHKEAAHMFI